MIGHVLRPGTRAKLSAYVNGGAVMTSRSCGRCTGPLPGYLATNPVLCRACEWVSWRDWWPLHRQWVGSTVARPRAQAAALISKLLKEYAKRTMTEALEELRRERDDTP